MLVAGEPSGDALGGQLMVQLRRLTNGAVTIIGVGGRHMRQAGLQSLYSIDETAVIGLRDVAPRLARILARAREAADFAVAQRPDLTVLIDSTDFMRRVAGRIKARAPDLRVVKYVSPQVWASRPGRAKALARAFDHMLCLFPFEPPFYAQAGLPATFVGNPVIERTPPPGEGARLRARLGIGAEERVVTLLPGSRGSEVRFLWPPFQAAIDQVAAAKGPLRVLLPTVSTVAPQVRAQVAAWGRPVTILESESDKWGAFQAADVALAASGTVATELALAGAPMVVGYKVGWLTALAARRIMTVKYLNILNIILDERAVPELLQEECTPANLAREMIALLSDRSARATQAAKVAAALQKLGLGEASPSLRAAEAILTLARQPGGRLTVTR
jgi:lipid-A-disaccharide synthase